MKKERELDLVDNEDKVYYKQEKEIRRKRIRKARRWLKQEMKQMKNELKNWQQN